MSTAQFNYKNSTSSFGDKFKDFFDGGNRAATAAANYQMQFQEHMFDRQLEADNTAVQRKVADMKAAGINPMVAASSATQGAGTPSAQSGTKPSEGGTGVIIGQTAKLISSALKPVNDLLSGQTGKDILKALSK